MGRMDQDPMVFFWQEELVISKQLSKVTKWTKEAIYFQEGIDPGDYRIAWTAPRRPVVDPTKDYPALIKKIAGGLDSRQSVIRAAGGDHHRIQREIQQDLEFETENGITFSSSAKSAETGVKSGGRADDTK
jgi:capsid protein